MKRFTKSAIAFLLAFVLVVSSSLPIFAIEKDTGNQPLVYSKQYNSGDRDTVCTTLDGTSAIEYYTDNGYSYDEFDDMSRNDLLLALRGLMTNTHLYKTTYDECHTLAHRSDCEKEEGEGTTDAERSVLLLYTGYTANQSNWNGWNREHVWPQSHGGNDDGLKVGDELGGADLHHVRPSDAGVNSSRGNKPYGESGENPTEKYGTNPAIGVLGGTYNSTYFEPNDNVKGDVARIVLYVWVRWGAEWGAEDANNPFNSVTEVFESVDLLLEWCALDPVDTWEMGRNEVVEDIQGNRNVFIDYPELAWLLFDKEFPVFVNGEGETVHMTTPSGEAEKQTSCSHTNKEVRESVPATCGKDGYSGDTYCKDCEKKLLSGSQIPATGLHSFTTWVIDTEAGKKTRTCTVCKKIETQDINAAECTHSFTTTRNKKSATCGEAGYTGDVCCMSCGEIITKGKEIAATGNHSYGEITEVLAPTDIKNGFGEHTCSVCEYKTVVIIPARYSDSEITVDILAANLETNQEKILLLLLLGVNDKALLQELSE